MNALVIVLLVAALGISLALPVVVTLYCVRHALRTYRAMRQGQVSHA